MVALEAIAWVAIILIVGAYLLLGTYIAKKFPNLRFFLGVILTFLIPALIACTGRTHQKLSNEPRYRSPFIGDLTRGTF